MDSDVKKEVRGRTLKLKAYDVESGLLDTAELRLKRLYGQTHEQIGGRRQVLTKRRKIAKAKLIIAGIFKGDIDVDDDAINQLKLMDQ